MRKIPPSLLIAIALCLLVFYQRTRINSLQSELNDIRQTRINAESDGKNHSPDKRNVREIASGNLLESEDSKTPRNPSTRSRRLFKNADRDRALIAQGMLASVNGIYGPFLAQLNLNEEEAEYFESLLAERLMNRQEFSQKWAHAPEDQQEKIEAETLKRQVENEAKIKKFLNYDAEYRDFQKYEPRIPEYQSLSGIKLALSIDPMSPECEFELIEALYECRVASEGTLQDGLSNWLSILEQPNSESLHRQWDLADRRLFERLPDILSPTQQALFRDHWAMMRAAQKRAMAALETD